MVILALLLIVISGATSAYWLVALVRTNRIDRLLPRVRDGLTTPVDDAECPSVTIIVPAHNEEAVIEACARTLLAQDARQLRYIFALDRCTDETASRLRACIANDDRVSIIEIAHCPDDWFGKPHALHTAAQTAQSDWLLFVDADTQLDARLVRAALSLVRQKKLDMLSLLSTLTVERAFERIAQPVATMVLMRLYPPVRSGSEREPRAFANGQFILIKRDMYARAGFGDVRDELTEDIALAKAVQSAGGRVGLALADGMFTTSMYESYADFAAGWRRIFTGACGRKVNRLIRHGLRVLGTGLLPAIVIPVSLVCSTLMFLQGRHLLAAALVTSIALVIVVQSSALIRIYRLSNVPRIAALFYPLGCVLVGGILIQSARALRARKTLRWAGRAYTLEPR